MKTKIPKRKTRRWLERWADKLALKADVEQPYWFIHNACGEEGTFCFDCGEKRRAELIASHPGKTPEQLNLHMLDGGWSIECDSCEHCEKCGQLLEYSLTDYGAESEWEHFQEHGISLRDPDTAYHVQAILQNGMKLVGLSKLRVVMGKSPNASS